MEGIKIRNMTKADIVEVYGISTKCFTTPWHLSSFAYELRNKDAILKVAVHNNNIIGYMCIRSLFDVTHILDLAVAHKFRQLGVGSMLISSSLEELGRSKPDISLITLEVRESNSAAIRLYEKFGFREIGKRKEYYKKPAEDAIIMEMDMIQNNTSLSFH